MIVLVTAFGALVGTLAGFLMHQDYRSLLGVERQTAIIGGIVLGGFTGLMGGVMMAL